MEALEALAEAARLPDVRELSPLQLAYLGDTLHDLCVRERMLSHRAPVGEMHRHAVRLVSASAQARMLERLEDSLTDAEKEIVRRGRNTHAKHSAPRHQLAADYQRATGLEALWGWLYVRGETGRMLSLMHAALEEEEESWAKRN